MEVWERAPRSDNLFGNEIGDGPTQAEMTAEANWLEGLKPHQFMELGEARGSALHRIFISELNHWYEFLIDLGDL